MAHYHKKSKQKNLTLTHEYIKNQLEGLEGDTFIKDFIALAKKHPPKKYEYYLKHEVYIKNRRRRMDTVIFLHVSYGKTLTIGIEIKGHRKNLIWDNKLFEYLGHTDYFFLAVPTVLIKPARLKASQDPHIGIIRMRDGKIIVFPERQDVPQEYRDEVYKKYFSAKKNSLNQHAFSICEGSHAVSLSHLSQVSQPSHLSELS